MTPDLTTTQTITFGSALAGAVLIFFFTALILLAYREAIQHCLQCWGLLIPIRAQYNLDYALFPRHYVFPRNQTDNWPCTPFSTTMTAVCHCAHTRAMATYSHDSSLEYFSGWEESNNEPHNATLRPSNVLRTLTPDATPNVPSQQDVWAAITGGPITEPDPKFPTETWGPEDTPANLQMSPGCRF